MASRRAVPPVLPTEVSGMSDRDDSEIVRTAGLVVPPTPSSVDDLVLVRERERKPVNEFLEQRHPLGSVPGWKACFSARYRDTIVAIVVVGRPVARAADDGSELSITRFARRDDRPANTGSWLIARARNWARLEGYATISAHSGIAGNYGMVYEAAGFEVTDLSMADGQGWLSQGDDRDTWDDYERRNGCMNYDGGR